MSCSPTWRRRPRGTGPRIICAWWRWSRPRSTLAEGMLKPGGTFLAKVFQGGAGGELVTRLKRSFAKVHHVKPKASRKESPEVYVLATGFRGAE